MTLVAYLAGGDEAHRIRLGKIGLESRADGSVGYGGIVFDDPNKTLVTRGWMDVEVHETDCTSAPVLYHGLLGNRTISRALGDDGNYRDALGRTIDCNIVDPNDAATFRMFVNSDAKRLAEDDDVRIAWALGAGVGGLSGLVDDDGLVNTAPNPFEDSDYRGRYAADVIEDMADALGKIKFVYTDPVDGTWHLFYDFPTAAVETSTLSISNDMGDTSSTCFYPLLDAVQGLDPSEMASVVRYVYLNGVVLEGNTTTQIDYFSAAATGGPNLGDRGIQIESTRVGAEATARHHAQAYLTEHSVERDTITVSILVPSTQVGLVRSGQRIHNRFTHLDGHESFVYSRIQSCLISEWVNNKVYLVTLELTNAAGRGTGAGGGGGTGGVPLPPPGPPSLVQSKFDLVDSLTRTITLDNPPTAGNWLIIGVSSRGTSITLPAGWTDHPHGQITPGSDYGRMAYRQVGTGESAAVEVTTTGARYAQVWEVTGIDGTVDTSSFADVDTGTQPATINGGTLTPTAGLPMAMFLFLVQHNSDWAGNGPTTMSTPAGWTQNGEFEVTVNGDLHPNAQADSQFPTSASGSYGTSSTIAGGGNNYGGWGGLALAFAGADATTNPPQPGQWVDWAIVTMTTSGGVSVGTTLFPYADRSLQVKVDGVLISPASYTETDPTTGAFALSWLLDPSEVVQVRYQGRF